MKMPFELTKRCQYSIIPAAYKNKPYQTKLPFEQYIPSTQHGDSTPGWLKAICIGDLELQFIPAQQRCFSTHSLEQPHSKPVHTIQKQSLFIKKLEIGFWVSSLTSVAHQCWHKARDKIAIRVCRQGMRRERNYSSPAFWSVWTINTEFCSSGSEEFPNKYRKLRLEFLAQYPKTHYLKQKKMRSTSVLQSLHFKAHLYQKPCKFWRDGSSHWECSWPILLHYADF